jgi:hypothetical protein
MMGMHYIEVTSGEPNYLDPVYRFTTELFRVRPKSCLIVLYNILLINLNRIPQSLSQRLKKIKRKIINAKFNK